MNDDGLTKEQRKTLAALSGISCSIAPLISWTDYMRISIDVVLNDELHKTISSAESDAVLNKVRDAARVLNSAVREMQEWQDYVKRQRDQRLPQSADKA